jgi:hypothetical protein
VRYLQFCCAGKKTQQGNKKKKERLRGGFISFFGVLFLALGCISNNNNNNNKSALSSYHLQLGSLAHCLGIMMVRAVKPVRHHDTPSQDRDASPAM